MRLDKSKGMAYLSMLDIFMAWHKEAEKLGNEEISREEYDAWRYGYPENMSY